MTSVSNIQRSSWGQAAFGAALLMGLGFASAAGACPHETRETLSAGYYHTCGVRSDGTVTCWGDNGGGQLNAPAGTFTQVSTSYKHTCGVKDNGTVACWGSVRVSGRPPRRPAPSPRSARATITPAGSGPTAPSPAGGLTPSGRPPRRPAPSPRSVREMTTPAGCGATAPSPAGGVTTPSQATPPAGTFTQVSAGGSHTCGVKSDGTVACWGKNNYGQSPLYRRRHLHPDQRGLQSHLRGKERRHRRLLGVGHLRPGPLTVAGTFTQVSAGVFHTCGVRSNGTVDCWGWSSRGQATPPADTFDR